MDDAPPDDRPVGRAAGRVLDVEQGLPGIGLQRRLVRAGQPRGADKGDRPGVVWAALTEWAAHVARYHPRILAIDRASAAAADTDPDAGRHRAQGSADQLAACRRVAGRLSAEGALAEPWTADSGAELLWALLSPDLLTRLLITSHWGTGDLASRLAVLLHRTLTTGT